jgi:hypothetical protein
MQLEITKEKVLEAAEKCSTAKETLKVLFPEAFEAGVPSDLPESITVTLCSHDNPLRLMIGKGCAPQHLRMKCVVVAKSDVEITEYAGMYVIAQRV